VQQQEGDDGPGHHQRHGGPDQRGGDRHASRPGSAVFRPRRAPAHGSAPRSAHIDAPVAAGAGPERIAGRDGQPDVLTVRAPGQTITRC
jgi:hypothetical protein